MWEVRGQVPETARSKSASTTPRQRIRKGTGSGAGCRQAEYPRSAEISRSRTSIGPKGQCAAPVTGDARVVYRHGHGLILWKNLTSTSALAWNILAYGHTCIRIRCLRVREGRWFTFHENMLRLLLLWRLLCATLYGCRRLNWCFPVCALPAPRNSSREEATRYFRLLFQFGNTHHYAINIFVCDAKLSAGILKHCHFNFRDYAFHVKKNCTIWLDYLNIVANWEEISITVASNNIEVQIFFTWPRHKAKCFICLIASNSNIVCVRKCLIFQPWKIIENQIETTRIELQA